MAINREKEPTVVLLQNKKMWSCSFQSDGSMFSYHVIALSKAQVNYIKRK